MICDRCHYQTESITNMKRHLRRKIKCKSVHSLISCEDVWEKLFPITKTEFKCYQCCKYFETKQDLWYHNKDKCKGNNIVLLNYKDDHIEVNAKNSNENNIDIIKKQIRELQDKVKELQQQPKHTTVNNITDNDITNNNITINDVISNNIKDFKFVEGENISEASLVRMIENSDVSDIFQIVLELICANPWKYHSILLPYIKQPICKDGEIAFESKDCITNRN